MHCYCSLDIFDFLMFLTIIILSLSILKGFNLRNSDLLKISISILLLTVCVCVFSSSNFVIDTMHSSFYAVSFGIRPMETITEAYFD